MAVVATGGYGRGMLAPWSDIDLLFVLPYKQTPWGESVIEYMLYMLWDMGFKGRPRHAHRRSVHQALRRRHHHPHGDPRRSPHPRRQSCPRSSARFRQGVGKARPASSSPPSSRSATSATARRAKRATRSSPTSRRERAVCAICTRCTGSRKYLRLSAAMPATGSSGSSPPPRLRHFAAARLPLGRPLPSAFRHRPAGGAADVRRAAGARRADGLPRTAPA